MSIRILVAGAGHGGLTAAAILAKNGYDVTVVEKSPLKSIGYDWHDVFTLDTFDFVDIPRPDPKYLGTYDGDAFCGPEVGGFVPYDNGHDPNTISMDRKVLINYLIKHCKDCGVKFVFGTEITEPVMSGPRVIGFSTKGKKGKKTFYGDLVIDAAGMYSPIRSNLPEKCGIVREFSDSDKIFIYRAYYNKVECPDFEAQYKYLVTCYHLGRPGIDWIDVDEDYVDILIGKFGPLTQEEVDEAIADLREHDPRLGTEVVRGGEFVSIPIGSCIPKIISDGLAIVGDSASMVLPITGSGITASMKAGKLLASTVMADADGDYTTETLWSYQYRYFKSIQKDFMPIYMLRKVLTALDPDDVRFLFDNIVESRLINAATGGRVTDIPVSLILEKAIVGLPQAKLMVNIAKAALSTGSGTAVAEKIPSRYEKKAVDAWMKEYGELLGIGNA
ncbi:MAG: NAD(P)/FAD-dependent oxidoreductase [Clostridia bacterium]|nr:NAD(P)/FAD-dependent oxidoreductase [Clostridia bacterium]